MPTIESSLLVALTDQSSPRTFPLSKHCAVIVLSRVIRALNLVRVQSFEELAARRECAASLIFLRLEIQRESMREIHE